MKAHIAIESSSYCVPVRALATDLDGTLIPLKGEDGTASELEQLSTVFSDSEADLLYVTGRHLASVFDAIVDERLPVPDWIVCDLGTSIYRRIGKREIADDLACLVNEYVREVVYDRRLDGLVESIDLDAMRTSIVGLPSFRLQESCKQGEHKLSFYVPAEERQACHETVESLIKQMRIAMDVISSIDPLSGDGLIDVLPKGVSKAYAIEWWRSQAGLSQEQIIYCGDSRNDYSALTAGYLTVLVGNTPRELAASVVKAHDENQWSDRLWLSASKSTPGVLEGCRWFGLLPNIAAANCHFGARVVSRNQTCFRLFSPAHSRVKLEVVTDATSVEAFELNRDKVGWHEIKLNDCPAGTLYQYRVPEGDGWSMPLPDPCSRFQPEGVHGPSQVVDAQHVWQFDSKPRPQRLSELIPYELHVACLTDEGTYASAIDRLDELAELGVNAIEVMPLAQCSGRWNWGYDGTHLFAPMNTLGSPQQLRHFVDEAHRRGFVVILDVVYNHFGPEGNYWSRFGDYVSSKHGTPWGDAPNFDEGPSSEVIRQLIVDNAIMWLDEYHFDGLRVDAIHCMADDSQRHISRQLGEEVRRWSQQQDRRVWLIAESNVYDPWMVADDETSMHDDDSEANVAVSNESGQDSDRLYLGGQGFDAQWCDDFVHSVLAVLRPSEQLTDRQYNAATDLSRTFRRGFVFEGDVRRYRGREVTLEQSAMDVDVQRVDTDSSVYCIQNHDFIGNHPLGKRLHQLTSLETQAAAAALLMTMPAVPMVFMGEEFASPNPFAFFVDFSDEGLRQAVQDGRRRDYPQHDWSNGVSPLDEQAFRDSKIGDIADGSPAMRRWYQQLIEFRKRATGGGLLRSQNLEVFSLPDQECHRLTYRASETFLHVLMRFVSVQDGEGTSTREESLSDSPHLQWTEALKVECGRTGVSRLDSCAAFGESGDVVSDSHLHPNQVVLLTNL